MRLYARAVPRSYLRRTTPRREKACAISLSSIYRQKKLLDLDSKWHDCVRGDSVHSSSTQKNLEARNVEYVQLPPSLDRKGHHLCVSGRKEGLLVVLENFSKK
jgi:hypothetical protein